MQLTKDEVQKIAELARIELTEEENDKRQEDLSNVLNYFDELSRLDTDNVEVIGNMTGMVNVFRNDVIFGATESEKTGILNNFLEEQDNFIKVKSIL